VSYSHDKTTKAKNNAALQDCFLFASWVKRKKNESHLKEYAHPVTPLRVAAGALYRIPKSVFKTGTYK
jgi:hypothetical protein